MTWARRHPRVLVMVYLGLLVLIGNVIVWLTGWTLFWERLAVLMTVMVVGVVLLRSSKAWPRIRSRRPPQEPA